MSCRGRAPKEELLRFVYADGALHWDERQVLHTRGLYLHDRLECLSKTGEVGRWIRALRLQSEQGAGIGRGEVTKVLEEVYARALRRV